MQQYRHKGRSWRNYVTDPLSATLANESLPETLDSALSDSISRYQAQTYVLITAVRDERLFIHQTIEAVVAQTVRPLRWVIVSDGSTDGTDDIVREYAARYSWIEFVRMPDRPERHFGGKAEAINEGYARVKNLQFDVVGNVDADVTFDADYFAFLLRKFSENPGLGVAGTPFREGSMQYDYRFTSMEHVSGPCQLFRRECFEAIGGYVPSKIGGVDLVAVLSARIKGWQTRTFLEKPYLHHRPMGSAVNGVLLAPFRGGKKDYALGNHPLWQVCRCLYQMTRRPVVVGGILRLAGYTWAMLCRVEKQMPKEMLVFKRREEMRRLVRFVERLWLGSLPLSGLHHMRHVWHLSQVTHAVACHGLASYLYVLSLGGPVASQPNHQFAAAAPHTETRQVLRAIHRHQRT